MTLINIAVLSRRGARRNTILPRLDFSKEQINNFLSQSSAEEVKSSHLKHPEFSNDNTNRASYNKNKNKPTSSLYSCPEKSLALLDLRTSN